MDSAELEEVHGCFAPSSKSVALHDYMKVPCRPEFPLFGLSFLSCAATAERVSGVRKDVLLEEDEVDLPLWMAKEMFSEGKVRILFPEVYRKAHCLLADALSLQAGSLSPFYFEVGLELCKLVEESDWPVPNIKEILQVAETTRWTHILQFGHRTCDNKTFFNGMTWKERTLYNQIAIQDSRLQDGNTGSCSLGGFGDVVTDD